MNISRLQLEVMENMVVLPKPENLTILIAADIVKKLHQQYLDVKEQLSKLGFDKFYHVIKTVWNDNDRHDYEHYYTPLLCFLDNSLESMNVIEKNRHAGFSYEISSEFSLFNMNITIGDIMSIKSMNHSQCPSGNKSMNPSGNKSITGMRTYAEKFGEKDQLEKLLLVLIDNFPSIDLVNAILRAKDQVLTKRMMPWISEHGSRIDDWMITPVVEDFPNDMICDLIDCTNGNQGGFLLAMLVDMARRRSNDVVLIHYLKKHETIPPPRLTDEPLAYLRALLKKIDHPDVKEAYTEEIKEIRKIKGKKSKREKYQNQMIKELARLDSEIRSYQKKIEELLLSCPADVQALVNE